MAESTNVIKEGYLKKRSSRGQWSSRYYILESNMIYYSKTKGLKPVGVIPLITFHFAATLPEKMRWDLLVMGTKQVKHTFTLEAQSEEDAKEWVQRIKATAQIFDKQYSAIKNLHFKNKAFSGKFWRHAEHMLLIVKQLAEEKQAGIEKDHSLLTKEIALPPKVPPSPSSVLRSMGSNDRPIQDEQPRPKPAHHKKTSSKISGLNILSDVFAPTSRLVVKTPTSKNSPREVRFMSPKSPHRNPDRPLMRSNRSETLLRNEIRRENAKLRGTLRLSGALKIKSVGTANLFVGIKRWQRAYFALYDEVLIYYKKKGGDPVGHIPLHLIRSIVKDSNNQTRFQMTVDSTPCISTFVLLARTPRECKQWVVALSNEKIYHDYKNLITGDANKRAAPIRILRRSKELTRTDRDAIEGTSTERKNMMDDGASISSETTTTTTIKVTKPTDQIIERNSVTLLKEEQSIEDLTRVISVSILSKNEGTTTLEEESSADEDIWICEGQPFENFACHSEQGFITGMDKPNQDSQTYMSKFAGCEKKAMFIVLDGHGPVGHKVSQFCAKTLMEILTTHPLLDKHPYKAFRRAFKETNQRLEATDIKTEFSGTTCVLVYLNGDRIYSANIGDSRAVLGKRVDEWECHAIPLSCDHKPARPEEKKRIENANGRVEPKQGAQGDIGSARVWLKDKEIPGLAVSRAFGDALAASIGVICRPEIWDRQRDLNDAFIILASDGVWEFITSEEAVDMVSETENPEDAVEVLIEESKKRWAEEDWESRDDITCQVIFL